MTTSRMQISKKVVFINTISKFLSLLINVSIMVWLQQYLLKRISPEEYALYPVVMSIMEFVPLISIVLTSGLGRYITVAYAKNDDEEVVRIVSTMFPILLVIGTILLFAGGLCAYNIDHLLPIAPDQLRDSRIMLAILMFVAAAQLPASAFEAGFVVTQRLVLQDLIILGCQLLNNILLFILLFTVSTKILWVVIALAISQIVQLLIIIPISIKLCPSQKFRYKSFRFSLAKEITTFGGWNFVSRMVTIIKENFDPLILLKYASAIHVATFHVGGLPYRQVSKLITPMLLPIFPVLGALEATNQIERMRKIYYRYTRYCLWLILLPSMPMIVFSKEAIFLYIGNKYIDAHVVIIILLFALIIQSYTLICPAIAIARGVIRGLAVREAAFMVLNILLTLAFVIYFKLGAIGSALATLLSIAAIYPIFMIPFSLKIVEGSLAEFRDEIFIPTLIPFVTSLLSMLYLKQYLNLNDWLGVISWSLAGGCIYILILYKFALKENDKEELRELLDKISSKLRTKTTR